MEKIIENKNLDGAYISILYFDEDQTYYICCNTIIIEETGQSCYRTKKFKYKANAFKFYNKLNKLSKRYIIDNQNELFK